MERTTDLTELKEGKAFTWGLAIKIHEVGEYAIIEYHPWRIEGCSLLEGNANYDEVAYCCYVDGSSTARSFESLDSALAACIAYRHDGPNSQAAHYFIKGLNKKEDYHGIHER